MREPPEEELPAGNCGRTMIREWRRRNRVHVYLSKQILPPPPLLLFLCCAPAAGGLARAVSNTTRHVPWVGGWVLLE
jgi:hypothetical protein